MNSHYDAIVIGVGGIGSAALYELARRGLSVLGIEQFGRAHDRGSSHGETRLIRRAYFEHPDYVPLVGQSFRAWSELENQAGKRLFYRSGLFLAGPPAGAMIAGTRKAAAAHDLDITTLTAAEAFRRFPNLRPSPDMEILFEPDAGFLRVEECVGTHVSLAAELGADVIWNTAVETWQPDGGGFRVRTAGGEFHAGKLVICGGPWAGRLLSTLGLPLQVRRKVVLWYRIENPAFMAEKNFPVFGFDFDNGFFYGFPSMDGTTLKVAEHTGGEPADPDSLDRELHASDSKRVTHFLRACLPEVPGDLARHSVCMYTMTPDEHFIVDRHPELPHLAFVAGLSGHGFKFAPVLGRAIADLACGEKIDPLMAFLSLDRRPGLSGLAPPPRE